MFHQQLFRFRCIFSEGQDPFLQDQQLFLLADNLDDERSPYAEFLDHITALQIKMLNDTFDFEKDISIEDLEEEIRQNYTNDYMEGKAIHIFHEIMDILEYVPDGYSLEEDDDVEDKDKEDNYDDIEDLQEEEDMEADETMRWDDEDEDEDYSEEYGRSQDDDNDFDFEDER